MKTVLVSALLFVLPLGVLAQADAKAPAKQASKPVRRAPAPAQVPVEPLAPLGEAELEIARRVHVGHLPCELGASVTLEASPHGAGYFQLRFGKQTFHMGPVATSTGAIRLEDRRAGTVWLQLSNKSMLVSDKLGKRLVDACMNPEQIQVAERMKANPVPSVLDDVTPPDGALALK